jgi:hypothetical protein
MMASKTSRQIGKIEKDGITADPITADTMAIASKTRRSFHVPNK